MTISSGSYLNIFSNRSPKSFTSSSSTHVRQSWVRHISADCLPFPAVSFEWSAWRMGALARHWASPQTIVYGASPTSKTLAACPIVQRYSATTGKKRADEGASSPVRPRRLWCQRPYVGGQAVLSNVEESGNNAFLLLAHSPLVGDSCQRRPGVSASWETRHRCVPLLGLSSIK